MKVSLTVLCDISVGKVVNNKELEVTGLTG